MKRRGWRTENGKERRTIFFNFKVRRKERGRKRSGRDCIMAEEVKPSSPILLYLHNSIQAILHWYCYWPVVPLLAFADMWHQRLAITVSWTPIEAPRKSALMCWHSSLRPSLRPFLSDLVLSTDLQWNKWYSYYNYIREIPNCYFNVSTLNWYSNPLSNGGSRFEGPFR
jgi:hypothetical protein